MLGAALLVLGLVTGQAGAEPALSSTTSAETASITGSLLDPEELRLMAAIEAEAEETPDVPLVIPAVAELELDAPRDPMLARSIAGALIREPLLVDARLRFRPNEELVLRGRAGGRVEISLDGQWLDNALTRSDQRDDLGLLDPARLAQVEVDRSASEVRLHTRTPSVTPHLRTDAAGVVRSADRSTAVELGVEGGTGAAALGLRAGYQDLEELRLGGRIGRDVGSSERLNVSAQARLFGRREDPAGLAVGGSFDRLTNVLRYDLVPTRFGLPATAVLVDREASRGALFARLRLGEALELSGGFDRYQRDRTPAGGSKEIVASDRADTLQAAARANLGLSDAWSLTLDARFLSSAASVTAASLLHQGEVQRLIAVGGLRLRLEPLRLALDGGVSYHRTRLDGAEVTALAPRLIARAEVAVADSLDLSLGARLDARLPSFADWIVAHDDGVSPVAERALTGELGLHLHTTAFALRLTGFVRRAEGAFEPRASSFVVLPALLLAGAETWAEWRPFSRLRFDLGAAFTRAIDAPLAGVPGLLVQGNLRFDFSFRQAYVEIYARGQAGARETPEDVGSLASLTSEWTYAIVGAEVGATLGAGFSAVIEIDNAFDLPSRSFASRVGGPGLGLLATLRHRFELLREGQDDQPSAAGGVAAPPSAAADDIVGVAEVRR